MERYFSLSRSHVQYLILSIPAYLSSLQPSERWTKQFCTISNSPMAVLNHQYIKNTALIYSIAPITISLFLVFSSKINLPTHCLEIISLPHKQKYDGDPRSSMRPSQQSKSRLFKWKTLVDNCAQQLPDIYALRSLRKLQADTCLQSRNGSLSQYIYTSIPVQKHVLNAADLEKRFFPCDNVNHLIFNFKGFHSNC